MSRLGRPTRLRLSVWAVSESHPQSKLPTLDPDGLYAASVLQARRGGQVTVGEIELELQAPSTLLHDAIPCLEDAQTGVVLANSLPEIESYSSKLAGKHSEKDLLCDWGYPGQGSNGDAKRTWGQQKALELLVTLRLHPLVHQTLFHRDLFVGHTAQVYGSGLGFVARRSLPSRLRRQVQTTYADLAGSLSPADPLAAILREDNTEEDIAREEERQRKQLVGRAGLAGGKRQATGLLEEEKEKAGDAFRKIRLSTYAAEVFGALAQIVTDQRFVSGQERPCLLDLRLFSLLAPLLLSQKAFPALANSTLPKLLRSQYPALVEHSRRVQDLLWPVKTAIRLDGTTTIETPDWPLLPNRGGIREQSGEPLSLRVAHTMGRLTSEAYIFATRLSSRATRVTTSRDTSQSKNGQGQPSAPKTAAEEREARMVRLGTYAWAATSVVVAIGTAFASGLLAIEFKDEIDDGSDGIHVDLHADHREGEDNSADGEEEGNEKSHESEDGEEEEDEGGLEEVIHGEDLEDDLDGEGEFDMDDDDD